MTIEDIQNQVIEEFSAYEDWMDKYNYLIQISAELIPLSTAHKTEDNLIDGCQSKVWLHTEFAGGKIFYMADSDAIITKGLITLLIRVLSARTPKEIIDADLFFIEKIGLKENLSPTRSNGLLAMIKKMKLYALAYQAKGDK
ncbi:SufE family protein [Bacteroidota bacterium]